MQVTQKTGVYFRYQHSSSPAFTIVELLIVIVVIAILAVLVIVSYSAIQNNARTSTLQADLSSSYNVLANDYTTTASYPATLAAANNGIGITPTNGNTYSYTVNNSSSPAYYCLSETNTATGTTYYVTSTSNTAQVGSCVVSNLATRPIPSSSTQYSVETGNGAASLSWPTGDSPTGAGYQRMTFTTAATTSSVDQGTGYTYSNPLTANVTYTWSVYARTSVTMSLVPIVFVNPGNSAMTGHSLTVQPGVWTRLSYTFTPTSTVTAFYGQVRTVSPYTYTFPVGSTFDATMPMMTKGSLLYTYADGNYTSSGWSWTGTADASTSTGPPL